MPSSVPCQPAASAHRHTHDPGHMMESLDTTSWFTPTDWLHGARLAVSFNCLDGRDGECKNKHHLFGLH